MKMIKILDNKNLIRSSFFVIFIIGICFYTFFNYRIFIAGPQVFIETPISGSTITDSPLIKVKGASKNISYIEINGRQILTDENGIFDESFLLENGYNTIQIMALDKFDRSFSKTLKVVYKNFDDNVIELENDDINNMNDIELNLVNPEE